ncbi:MAG: PRC-barrel domain-containing protein [Planctomycetaceae bacterium]
MLHKLSTLIGYTIRATDGDLGAVEDAYFDDRDWAIRYFVVDTGDWLPGRLVLVAPDAITGLDSEEEAVAVDLTVDQVEGSPDIHEHEPVSRRHEIDVRAHYGWPSYWEQGAEATRTMESLRENAIERARPDDMHLQSARDVSAYDLHARDGELGRVEDYLCDDAGWIVRYLVVETAEWAGGRRVLIPPNWVADLDWKESKARIEHTQEEIRNAPPYDPARVPERGEEEELFSHYDRPPYWD